MDGVQPSEFTLAVQYTTGGAPMPCARRSHTASKPGSIPSSSGRRLFEPSRFGSKPDAGSFAQIQARPSDAWSLSMGAGYCDCAGSAQTLTQYAPTKNLPA